MALHIRTMMPSLEGATEWVNGEVGLDDLSGRPTLVQFWAISCPLCKINLPTIQQWKEVYSSQGLQFVAVHLPRGETDTDVAVVKQSVTALGISEPCAIDNQRILGNRFETGDIWPYYFLFDKDGLMRRRAAGSVGLRLIGDTLPQVIIEMGSL